MSYWRLLRQRVPVTLWIGQLTSAAGDRLYSMAMLWMSLELTGSAEVMGTTVVLQSLAYAMMGLIGGPLIDRYNRLRLAMFIDVVRMAIVLTVPIAYAFGELHIGLLLITSTLMGASDAVFHPAFESLLPTLVARETFPSLAGLMDTPSRFARMFGPGTSGILLSFMPVIGFFTIDSASFAVSITSLMVVSRIYRKSRLTTVVLYRKGAKRLTHDIVEGLHLVARDWRIMTIFAVDGVGNMAFSAFTLGGLFLATKVMNIGLGGYGLFIAAYGIGSLFGNFAAGNLPFERVRFMFSISGWLGIGVGFVLLGMTRSESVALLAIVWSGAFGSLAHVCRATFIAWHIEHEHLGKVNSLRSIVTTLSTALGTVVCGWLLDHWPAGRVIMCAGVFIIIVEMIVLGWVCLRMFGKSGIRIDVVDKVDKGECRGL